MTWFHLALFIHILGVIGLFSGLATELVGVTLLRRAKTLPQVQSATVVLSKLGPVFGMSGLLIFLSGFYMWYRLLVREEETGWVAVALISYVLIGAISGARGKKQDAKLSQLVGDSGSSLSDELKAFAQTSGLMQNVSYITWVMVGVLALMIFQPSVTLSVLVIALALTLGHVTYRWVAVRGNYAR